MTQFSSNIASNIASDIDFQFGSNIDHVRTL
jgi:hypothetical protein